MTDVRKLKNYINGEWVESNTTEYETVINPATKEAMCQVPLSTFDDLNKAAEVAQTTFSISIGAFSDGFRTTVLPVAIAIGNIQNGTIIGKLNGVIPPTTPIGYL